MSGFYRTDPDDRDAPVLLDEYHGIKPGDQVKDVGPVAPLQDPLTVTAIYEFRDNGRGGWVTAILDGGQYEVNADNLRLAEDEPSFAERAGITDADLAEAGLADDPLAAHLDGIRRRFEDGTLEHPPEECRRDMDGETCTFHDAERLLAAVEVVLALHRPGRIVILGSLCKDHEACRHFSITNVEADRITACPDCPATVHTACEGCTFGPRWPCPEVTGITRALLGEDITDAG